MKRFSISALALAAFVTMSLPVQAQTLETIGEIRMTFQGEETLFHTLGFSHENGEVETTATVELNRPGVFGGINSLSLSGTTGEGGGGATFHMLHHFDDHPQQGTTGIFSIDSSITYAPNGTKPPFWGQVAGASNVALTFELYEFDGSTGHAKGSFTGRLCQQVDLDGAPDPSLCEEVTGSFDTLLSAGES